MSLVELAATARGVIQDRAGNVQANRAAALTDFDGNPVTVYQGNDDTGPTVTPTTNERGELQGWVREGTYLLTVAGRTMQLEVPSGQGRAVYNERLSSVETGIAAHAAAIPTKVDKSKVAVNVADYGNDQQALLNAYAEALERNRSYLYIPAGHTVNVEALLDFTDDRIGIIGDGYASRILASGSLPFDSTMIRAHGRTGFRLMNLRLSCAGRARPVEWSGPTVGNPDNIVAFVAMENCLRGPKIGQSGVNSFSARMVACKVELTVIAGHEDKSIGLENFGFDTKLSEVHVSGYAVSALDVHRGVPMAHNCHWGDCAGGNVSPRAAAPYPQAVRVFPPGSVDTQPAGFFSVGDTYGFNPQNHQVSVTPGNGQTVDDVVIAHCKTRFDALQQGNATPTAGDNLWDFLRLEPSGTGVIKRAEIHGLIGAGQSNGKRLRSLVYVGNTSMHVAVEHNTVEFVAGLWNGTAPGVPAAGRRSGNSIVISSGYLKSSNHGTASVANGGTITHGLAAAPTWVSVESAVGGGRIAGHSAVSATTITVALHNHDGTAVTTAETVRWRAEV